MVACTVFHIFLTAEPLIIPFLPTNAPIQLQAETVDTYNKETDRALHSFMSPRQGVIAHPGLAVSLNCET